MHGRIRAILAVFLTLAFLIITFAACTKKEVTTSTETSVAAPASPTPADTVATSATAAPPPATATAAPVEGIATADGETSGVTATIKELKRSSGGTLSLKLVITNGSQKRLNSGYSFGDPDNEILDFNSIGGVQLIDPVGKKKYFVARDSEKKCVCSQGVKDIDPGESVNVWAKFPAPPAEVQKVSVIVPHFSPMDDVPISGE